MIIKFFCSLKVYSLFNERALSRIVAFTKVSCVFAILLEFVSSTSFAQQNVGGFSASETAPGKSAMLQVTPSATGTQLGFLPPRITDAQRNASSFSTIAVPGLIIYNTTSNQLQVNTASAVGSPNWISVTSLINLYTADGSLNASRIVTQNANALSFKANATDAFNLLNASTSGNIANFYLSGLTNGNSATFRLGQGQSANNSAEFRFSTQGSGNTNNALGIGFYGSSSNVFQTMADGTTNINGVLYTTCNAPAGYGLTLANNSTTGSGLQINIGNTSSGAVYQSFMSGSTNLGSISGTGSYLSYNTSSDMRLKRNIKNTHFHLADLMKIEVKDYVYKSDPKARPMTGFIAQQLFKVYPAAVVKGNDTDIEKGIYQVDYGKLTPLLVQAVQEQQKQIAVLIEQNNSFKKQIDKLSLTLQKLHGQSSAVSKKKAKN